MRHQQPPSRSAEIRPGLPSALSSTTEPRSKEIFVTEKRIA